MTTKITLRSGLIVHLCLCLKRSSEYPQSMRQLCMRKLRKLEKPMSDG